MDIVTQREAGVKRVNLIDRIDALLLAENNVDRGQRTAHYPSQASAVIDGQVIGKCLRAQFYAWKGVPKSNPADATAIWKFRSGDAIHELVPAWMTRAGFDAISEIPFRVTPSGLSHPISGRVDGLFLVEGEIVGLEIKSSYGRAITNRQTGVKYNGPKPEALLQIITYLHCTDLRHFKLLCIARDNFYRMECDIRKESDGLITVDGESSPVTFEHIVGRWASLEAFIAADTVPERDYFMEYPDSMLLQKYQEYLATSTAKKPQSLTQWSNTHKGDWQCSYCDWANTCKEAKGEEK